MWLPQFHFFYLSTSELWPLVSRSKLNATNNKEVVQLSSFCMPAMFGDDKIKIAEKKYCNVCHVFNIAVTLDFSIQPLCYNTWHVFCGSTAQKALQRSGLPRPYLCIGRLVLGLFGYPGLQHGPVHSCGVLRSMGGHMEVCLGNKQCHDVAIIKHSSSGWKSMSCYVMLCCAMLDSHVILSYTMLGGYFVFAKLLCSILYLNVYTGEMGPLP